MKLALDEAGQAVLKEEEEAGMTKLLDTPILPYTLIVGQDKIKLALELAYIAPRIGGVLISGQRGTGKSTAVRAFAQMIYSHLPVTLPINATEDRVVGGWKIDELMKNNPQRQPGILEEAHEKILYIDEVNLLDDYIVNMILDVASTGVLVVQREGRGGEGDEDEKEIRFILVGTMNPEEGGLRAQFLDRFGLMVNVTAETNDKQRSEILNRVLKYDEAAFLLKQGQQASFLSDGLTADRQYKLVLEDAKKRFYDVEVPASIVEVCIELANIFEVEGHRGDYIMALAARACAALQNASRVSGEHVKVVAPLAIQHRRKEMLHSNRALWSEKDDQTVMEVLRNV